MIKTFEELGEVLAEFENRISCLENSQNITYDPTPKEEKVVVYRHSSMGKLENDILQQTSRRLKHLEAKIEAHPKREEPF